jgi:hypothetical protein
MYIGNEKCMQKFGHITEAKRATGSPTWTWKVNVKLIIKEYTVRIWTGFNWLRLSLNNGLF